MASVVRPNSLGKIKFVLSAQQRLVPSRPRAVRVHILALRVVVNHRFTTLLFVQGSFRTCFDSNGEDEVLI